MGITRLIGGFCGQSNRALHAFRLVSLVCRTALVLSKPGRSVGSWQLDGELVVMPPREWTSLEVPGRRERRARFKLSPDSGHARSGQAGGHSQPLPRGRLFTCVDNWSDHWLVAATTMATTTTPTMAHCSQALA